MGDIWLIISVWGRSLEVRIWDKIQKTIPALKKNIMAVDPYNIGIQMKQKELTRTYDVLNWKTLCSPKN